jgi:predicted RNA-binding Zn-ribbon protein involved in translation (DUF1610 family)
LWQNSGLEHVFDAPHNRGMAAGNLWTTEYFSCPNCGVPYTATREQHADKQSGNFRCEVCGSKVHTWSGNYDFFNWKVEQAKSSRFGRRWG